jgi:hypothetical protein
MDGDRLRRSRREVILLSSPFPFGSLINPWTCQFQTGWGLRAQGTASTMIHDSRTISTVMRTKDRKQRWKKEK